MKDNGGSAFPSHGSMGEVSNEGMTLRDYFAAKVLCGLMTEYWNSDSYREPTFDLISKSAYALADAMMRARI